MFRLDRQGADEEDEEEDVEEGEDMVDSPETAAFLMVLSDERE